MVRKYIIETASEEDHEDIVAFQLEMAKETENLDLEKERVDYGVGEVIKDPSKGMYIVARDKSGRAVASLMVTREWSDWRGSWYWWVQSVYVKPECRGEGVFKRMYADVVARANKEGVSEVRLYVDKANNRAQATYEKLGMSESHYLMYEEKLG